MMETLIKYLLKAIDWLIGQIFGDAYNHFKNKVFGGPLNHLKNKVLAPIQGKIKVKSKSFQVIHQDEGVATIGGRKTSFVICGGSGEFFYDRDAVQVRYDDSLVQLPEELKRLRDDIESRELQKKEQGLKHMYNTHQVALTNAFQTNSDFVEKPYPVFHFKRSDYYNFQATVGSLDTQILSNGKTIREEYIDNEIQDLHLPSSILSQGVGMVLTVVTADERIILTRRRHDTGIRPNELDVSVVEAIDPYQDALDDSYGVENKYKTIDLYKAAFRGLKEELGIIVKPDQIHLLGFGVDLDYYQWNIIGTVETELTSEQVLEKKSSGIHGLNELSKIEFIQHHPVKVAELLRDQPLWSTAQIALYWTIIYNLGNPAKTSTEKVFHSVYAKASKTSGR